MSENEAKAGKPVDETLADRVRAAIGDDPNVAEIRMMGGLCFTLNGNMLVGTMKGDNLLVRVGEQGHSAALARPGAGPMAFTGRAMKGFVIVAGAFLDDAALREWVATATAFVGPMPAKKPGSKKPAKR